MTWGDVREHICRALRRRPDPNNWSAPNIQGEVEHLIYRSEWDEFYAICEVVPDACNVSNCDELINKLFEEEGSPWRMTDGQIGPIFPDEVETVLVEAKAAVDEMQAEGPAVHLTKARRHLSPTSGDKENAVKEAVSALEAAIKAKSGHDDFDDGLKVLKQQRLPAGAWPASVQAL